MLRTFRCKPDFRRWKKKRDADGVVFVGGLKRKKASNVGGFNELFV
jgi:hypothetical protein